MSLKRTVCALTLAAIAATAGVSARHLVTADGDRHDADGGGNRHVAWCHERFASYRERDNSFQPRNGLRAPCISPYHADRLNLSAQHSDPDPGTTGAISRNPIHGREPPVGD